MTARLVQDNFPTLRGALLDLVREHQKLPDEPLHLAVAYVDATNPAGLTLLEVIGNFGGELIDSDRRLLEVAYPSAQIFPSLEHARDLRLVLTSPSELKAAILDAWDSLSAFRAEIRAGSYEVIVEDGVGREIMRELTRAIAA